jgi:microcystin-dependent protein
VADDLMETLFKHLWDTIDSTRLTILTSAGGGSTKGATASDDWIANKRIALPDMRGMMVLGIDGARGQVTDAQADLMGGNGGAAKVSLTANEAPTGGLRFAGSGGAYTISAGTTVTAVGSVTAHENMPPYFACNWMIFTGVTYT